MIFEVRPDGTILYNGQIVGRTNNPDEVRRRVNQPVRGSGPEVPTR